MSHLQQKIHDIRKPLNTISMQAELIKMISEASENSPTLAEASNKIIANSKRCSEMLQELYEELQHQSSDASTRPASK